MSKLFMCLVGVWLTLTAVGLALELLAHVGLLEPLIVIIFRFFGVI